MAEYQTFGGEQLVTFTLPDDTEEVLDYGLNNIRPETTAVIYGPDSKLREQLTDMRNSATVYTTGLLLGAHPVISSALTNPNSYFFDDKWGRLKSSANYIVPLVDGDNAVQRASAIGKIHRKIYGFDAEGRRRNARYPEVWTFAHLAIMSMVERKMDEFDMKTYSDKYRDELYQEERVLYGCYGVSDECLPATRQDYEEYFPDFCRTELTRTESIEDTLGMLEQGKIDCPPQALKEFWGWPAEESLAWMVRLLATGGLGKEMQDKLGAKWDLVDQTAYNGLKRAVRRGWQVLPDHIQLVPDVARTVQPPESLLQRFCCSLGETFTNLDFSKIDALNALRESGDNSRLRLIKPVAGIMLHNARDVIGKTLDRQPAI